MTPLNMGIKPGQGRAAQVFGTEPSALGSQYSGAKKSKRPGSQARMDQMSVTSLREDDAPCIVFFCMSASKVHPLAFWLTVLALPPTYILDRERKKSTRSLGNLSCCPRIKFPDKFRLGHQIRINQSCISILIAQIPFESPVRCRLGPPKSQSPKAHDRIRPPFRASYSTIMELHITNTYFSRSMNEPNPWQSCPNRPNHRLPPHTQNLALSPIPFVRPGITNKQTRGGPTGPSHLMHVLAQRR
ncbi:hypothetical protein V8C40DRAFT_120959 [Trichoderma camerunense]